MEPKKQNFYKDVGDRIKKILSIKGVSITTLQQRTGSYNLTAILNGHQSLSLYFFKRICEELSITSDYLLFGEDDENRKSNKEELDFISELDAKTIKQLKSILVNPRGLEMIKEYNKASIRNKSKILKIAQIINTSKEE